MGSCEVPPGRGSILILFGSQTGNAQDVAERIGREGKLLLYQTRVLAMDAYDVTQLPQEHLVIFVTSTTGQGDVPDNMKRFWKFLLRKGLGSDSLSHMHCAVFGLGDSGYQKYNLVAKKLHRRLEGLGAVQVVERGLGDDQHPNGYEAALDPWLTQLWAALAPAYPLPGGQPEPILTEEKLMQLGTPKYKITVTCTPGPARVSDAEEKPLTCNGAHSEDVLSADEKQQSEAIRAAANFRNLTAGGAGLREGPLTTSGAPASNDPPLSLAAPKYGPWKPFMAPLIRNTRVTSEDHFQDTRHIEVDLGGSGLHYHPGDVLAIFPRTPSGEVDKFLQRLSLDGNMRVRVELEESGKVLAGTPSDGEGGEATGKGSVETSMRSLVQGVLDISGASPRRRFFQVLSHFTDDELQREKLQEFSSVSGRDELYRYNQREGRTVLEVLEDFHSCHPPLHWLLEVCPHVKPRLFSIASSQLLHPREAHILAAVVQWQTPYKRSKRGLCTSWLAGLDPSKGTVRVPVWVERGTMKLPENPQIPLILVGPGTGVAPFRSFLQERQAQKRTFPSLPLAPAHLFFGCRSREKDLYYKEDWSKFEESGILASPGGLVTAFSRDQQQKVYVSHKLKEHSSLIWALLQQGALIYVCGSAEKMPSDVVKALQHVVEKEGRRSPDDADKYVRQLETSRRYFVETWS